MFNSSTSSDEDGLVRVWSDEGGRGGDLGTARVAAGVKEEDEEVKEAERLGENVLSVASEVF